MSSNHAPASENGQFGLSLEQYDAVIGTRDLFLQACPGSGKTRSVAARVAWMRQEGKSLALLSFTRVGASEISEAVFRAHGVSIAGDDFVGTVQSFLQKYVLTPFAHLVTGASTGVHIDQDQVEELDPAGLRTQDYSFQLDGSVLPNRPGQSISQHLANQIKTAKMHAAKHGVVCLGDDVYWAYRTLEAYPEIRRAVATRFDEVIVDEAQDLDAQQIECLRLLKQSGLDSLVLVGDYDQTIYEWRGSNPELCEQLARDVNLAFEPLTENYRSSQQICDLASKFRKSSVPDKAVGPHRDCTIPPILIRYSPGQEKSLPSRLENLANHFALEPDSKAILVRKGAVGSLITGVQAPTVRGAVKTLLTIAQTRTGISLDHYREVEKLLLRRAFGSTIPDPSLDKNIVRSAAISVIDDLPSLEGNLLDWAAAAEISLDAAARELAPALLHNIRLSSFPPEWSSQDIEQMAVDPVDGLRVDTVHAFKGESIDAVMLVAGQPSPRQKRSGYGDAADWSLHLRNPSAGFSENTRLAYVAFTRAKRLCVIALPDDSEEEHTRPFLDAGFQLDPSEESRI